MNKVGKNGNEDLASAETVLEQATDELGVRVRCAGEALSGDDPEALLGTVVTHAGRKLESAGDRLRETEPGEILALARGFAREKPLAFLASSLLLGFLLGRLMKAGDEPLRLAAEDEERGA